MRKALFTFAMIALFGAAVVGCEASGEIDARTPVSVIR